MTRLSPDIRAWIGSVRGSPVADVEELTGGASRSSFIVTGEDGQKSFLRLDEGTGPLSGTRFTLAREYSVLAFLQGKGVPVARTYAFSPVHDAILMEFIPGFTTYQRTGSAAEEARLQRDLIAAIVALQTVDPSGLDALGDYCGAPLGEAIPGDLAIWAELYRDKVTPRDPLLEFALNWLSHDVPDPQDKAVLVHGDVGPGNFLVSDGRISALIDWEMVRVGHKLEDLACIIARALGAPFGAAGRHIANYEQLTGQPVDRRKLDYALALVLTRWTIAIAMALSRPSAAQNVPMLFAFRQINARALVEALCRYYGLPLEDGPYHFADRAQAGVPLAYSRDSLTALAARDELPAADRYKLRGVVDLLAYLKSYIDYGPETYEAEELVRIGKALGTQFADLGQARATLCDYAATVDPAGAVPLVEFLRWRCRREHEIMRMSLNERADNAIAY
jgi:aminoglycoside phosphotransferase (APT) family kinase protein